MVQARGQAHGAGGRAGGLGRREDEDGAGDGGGTSRREPDDRERLPAMRSVDAILLSGLHRGRLARASRRVVFVRRQLLANLRAEPAGEGHAASGEREPAIVR
ncbi:MAG: hypothetical protein U0235_12180 [Polyangiaceae bacterium]